MLNWCIPVYPCSKWKKKKRHIQCKTERDKMGWKTDVKQSPYLTKPAMAPYQSEGSSIYLLWCRESEMMMVNGLVALFLTGCTSSNIVVCFVGFTIPNYSTEDTHTNHVMHWIFKYIFIQLHISPSHVTQNEQKEGISKELYLLMNQTNLLNLQ